MKRVSRLLNRAIRYPAEAFITAAVVGLLMFCLILALSVFGQPRIVDERSLPAVTAWAALASALLTGLLAVGAGLAAIGLRDQLAESQRLREASFRPHLLIRPGTAIPEEGWVLLPFANVGTGVALNVAVSGWMLELPPGWPDTPEPFVVQHAEDGLAAEGAAAHLRGSSEAIAGGGEGSVWLRGRVKDDEHGFPRYFLVGRVTYEDVFGNRFAAGNTTGGLTWTTTRNRREPLEDDG